MNKIQYYLPQFVDIINSLLNVLLKFSIDYSGNTTDIYMQEDGRMLIMVEY